MKNKKFPGMFEFEMSDEFKHEILREIEFTSYDVNSIKRKARAMDVPWPGEEGHEEKAERYNALLRKRDLEYNSLGTLVMWLVRGGVPSEEIRAAMEAGEEKAREEEE